MSRVQRAPGSGRHVDVPKDVQFGSEGNYHAAGFEYTSTGPTSRSLKGDMARKEIKSAVELLAKAKRPILYTGGGVINSGPARRRSC